MLRAPDIAAFRTTDGTLMICYHGRTRATGRDRIAFISRTFHTDGKLIVETE